MAKTVKNVQVFRDHSAGERVAKATWEWGYASQTEKYEITWGYHTKEGGNYFDVSSISGTSHMQSTYNFPDSADKVWFHVKPISKTYKTDKNTDAVYWTADPSAGVAVPDLAEKPSTPSAPTVTITGTELIAEISNIDRDEGQYNHIVWFEVVQRSDELERPVYARDWVVARYQEAAIRFNVELDQEYKVRCWISKHPLDDPGYDNEIVASDPSSFSEWKSSGLTAPQWTSIESATKSIDVTWTAVRSVIGVSGKSSGYEIEYTPNERYFDASDDVVKVTVENEPDQNKTYRHIDNIDYVEETQNRYYFRIRAFKETSKSEWSKIFAITVGSKPSAPTTWSLTSTAIVGDDLVFYWVHNSKDNSRQTSAKIQFKVGDKTVIEEMEYEPDLETEEKTYSYTLKTSNWKTNVYYKRGERVPYNNKLYRCIQGGVKSSDANKPGGSTEESDETWALVSSSWPKLTNGSSLKWSVCTRGAIWTDSGDEGYSDWSVQRSIRIYETPSVTLQVVNKSKTSISTVTSFPFYISATPSQNANPIGYHISISANSNYTDVDAAGNTITIQKGEEVYSKYFSLNNDLMIEMSAGNINLKNGISYKVSCVATMDSGLDAEKSAKFTVSWSETIPEPIAGIGIKKGDISAYIMPTCEKNGTLVSNAVLSVYRIEADGSLVEIAKDVKNKRGFVVTDPHPALNYARYRIVAKSTTTGAISYYDMPSYEVGEKAIIIQWNETWRNFDDNSVDAQLDPPFSGSLLRLPYNINVSESNDTDVALIEYIGRSHPVSYYGTQLGSKATWSVDIDRKDTETIYGLRRLARWVGDVYVREPSGAGYWANVKVSFSQTHLQLTIPVTLEIVRVEGGV